MDRQHLHGSRVGVEPAAALLRFGAFGADLVDPPGQPCPQRGQAKLGFGWPRRAAVRRYGQDR